MVQAQDYRLGQGVQPLRQSVFLKVDPARETFSGTTAIDLEVKRAGSPLRFHCADIQVEKGVLVRGSQRLPLKIQPAQNEMVVASSAAPLAPGRYRLELEFQGPFNHRSAGLYKYEDQGRPFLSSQFEMCDARRCFPCFDEPCFKIPYQLTVQALPASGSTTTVRRQAKTDELRSNLLLLYSLDTADSVLLTLAREQTDRYLSGSGEVDPSTIKTYLRLAAQAGDGALLEQVKKAMQASSDPQRRTTLLSTLGYFAVPEVQDKALDLMLDESVTPSDLRMLITFNGDGESRRLRLQDWMFKHYEALRSKMPNAFAEELVLCLQACPSGEALAQVQSFFARAAQGDEAVQRGLAKMAESASNLIRIREQGQASFDAALAASSPLP